LLITFRNSAFAANISDVTIDVRFVVLVVVIIVVNRHFAVHFHQTIAQWHRSQSSMPPAFVIQCTAADLQEPRLKISVITMYKKDSSCCSTKLSSHRSRIFMRRFVAFCCLGTGEFPSETTSD